MTFSNLFNWFIAATVFSAPILALTVDHGGTGNYKLLIVIGLLSGWKQLRNFNRIEVIIFGGLLLLFLANLLSFSNTEVVDKGERWLGKYLYLFLGMFAYAVIKPRFQFLAKYVDLFLIINSVLIGAIAAYQIYYLGLPRAHGIVNAIMFGNISIMMFGILLCRILIHGNNWLFYVSAFSCLFAAVMSGTRGALIAVPVVVLMVFYLLDGFKQRKLRILFVLVVIAVVLASTIKESPVRDRIERTVTELRIYSADRGKAISLTLRFEFWINSLQLWKENPILGIGPGDYNAEMKRYIESGKAFNRQEENYKWTPHSNLVNALVTSGLVGLLFHILALYLIPAYSIWKARIPNQKSTYFLVVLVSYFIFGISTTWIATHSAFSMFMLFFLMTLAATENNNLRKGSAINA